MKISLSRCVLAAAIAGLAVSSTQAEPSLRMAHFWTGPSGVNQEVLQAWADTITEEPNGDLTIQMFPAGTLAKPDSIYEAAANGIADIGATAQGYTAGRSPLSQIVELPGVASSATQGACVLQTLYDDGRRSPPALTSVS